MVQQALPQSVVPVGQHWLPLQTCPEPQQPPAQVAPQSGADAAAVHCPLLQPRPVGQAWPGMQVPSTQWPPV